MLRAGVGFFTVVVVAGPARFALRGSRPKSNQIMDQ